MFITTCGVCGKDFECKPSRLEGKDFICCSRECSALANKKENLPNVKCWACGKDFWIKESHLAARKNPERVCCSRECAKLEKSDRLSGSGNHQFGLKGELNASHKADIRISNYGYVKVRCVAHPLANEDGYMLFHRLVYEQFLLDSHQFDLLVEVDNRLVLPRDVIVHHVDGNKLNNSLSNLSTITLEEHTSLHRKGTKIKKGKLVSGKLFKKHDFDAGQDVFSIESKAINPGESAVIHTGLQIEVPEGCVGLLWSRSGLSVKQQIEVGAGCIDHGYTGEVLVHLYNHGKSTFHVEEGMRIAQLITLPINQYRYEESSYSNKSDRGEAGFGSTGL